jgi:hypothetical protein
MVSIGKLGGRSQADEWGLAGGAAPQRLGTAARRDRGRRCTAAPRRSCPAGNLTRQLLVRCALADRPPAVPDEARSKGRKHARAPRASRTARFWTLRAASSPTASPHAPTASTTPGAMTWHHDGRTCHLYHRYSVLKHSGCAPLLEPQQPPNTRPATRCRSCRIVWMRVREIQSSRPIKSSTMVCYKEAEC